MPKAFLPYFTTVSADILRICRTFCHKNSIQLLDGTLGAHEGAFTTARVGAVAGIEVSLASAITASGSAANATKDVASVTASNWHMSKPSKEEQKPGFTIDLEDVAITGFVASGSAVTGNKQIIKVDLGNGQNLKLNVKGTSSGAWQNGSLGYKIAQLAVSHTVGIGDIDSDGNGTITGDEIAEVVANIIGGVKGTTTNPSDVIAFATQAGNAFYNVTADGNKLVFTYAGNTANKANATAKDPVVDTMATLKGNVKVTISTTGNAGQISGNPHHAVIDIKEAIEGDSGYRAGIGMTLTEDIVADGVRLVIEDKTFVFRTNADSVVGADAAAGEILIDVSAFATGDQINAAIKQMSNHTTANFKINALASDEIWIDQTEESLAANNFYTELSDLTSLISANRGGKAAGLKVTMDASTLQDGDAVRIDGQTCQFVSKAGQADITGAKEIVLASIGDGLTNGELIDALIDNLPAPMLFINTMHENDCFSRYLERYVDNKIKIDKL